MVESFLYMPQILLTAAVIRLGETKVHDTKHPLAGTLQGALNFLTTYSFGRWVIDSYLEMEYLIERNMNSRSTEYEFPPAWKFCVEFFLPLCIYFRFMSVLRLLRVKRLLRQSEKKNVDVGGQGEFVARSADTNDSGLSVPVTDGQNSAPSSLGHVPWSSDDSTTVTVRQSEETTPLLISRRNRQADRTYAASC